MAKDDFPDSKDLLEKALDPRTRPVVTTIERAEALLSRSVYEASALLEQLESSGLVRGNGHHMRQEIAEFATKLLKERWKGPPSTAS